MQRAGAACPLKAVLDYGGVQQARINHVHCHGRPVIDKTPDFVKALATSTNALDGEVMLPTDNVDDLPRLNGFPLRLGCPAITHLLGQASNESPVIRMCSKGF